MKKILIALVFLFSLSQVYATHITGGEVIYEYIGPGAMVNSTKYRITLRLFRDELNIGGAAMPNSVWIGIFNNDNLLQYPGAGQHYVVPINGSNIVPIEPFPPCMTNPPSLSYKVGYFPFTVDLPNNLNGYTATYNTCCRVHPMVNVNYPTPQGTGSTYICRIPGSDQLPPGGHNSSPQF